MKALLARIDFFEALFKVHYTKAMKLTYPMPLPTTVAGIFGAALGIDRTEDIPAYFDDCLFGSKTLSVKGRGTEVATYLQHGPDLRQGRRGVAPTTLLLEPSYLIAMAAPESMISETMEQLENRGYAYLPYGGQNDYFLKDLRIIRADSNVSTSQRISNYAHQDAVHEFDLKEGAILESLPVMHKMGGSRNFFFVSGGALILKETTKSVEEIGLYSLKQFHWLEG